MLRFDGKGNIKINRGSQGSNGSYGVASGSGSYSLNSHCTGVGKIMIRAGGQVVDQGKFNFYVGGTRANQRILARIRILTMDTLEA